MHGLPLFSSRCAQEAADAHKKLTVDAPWLALLCWPTPVCWKAWVPGLNVRPCAVRSRHRREAGLHRPRHRPLPDQRGVPGGPVRHLGHARPRLCEQPGAGRPAAHRRAQGRSAGAVPVLPDRDCAQRAGLPASICVPASTVLLVFAKGWSSSLQGLQAVATTNAHKDNIFFEFWNFWKASAAALARRHSAGKSQESLERTAT